MCFCFTSNGNCDPPKFVVDFLRERDTFRNKIMKIVEDFDEKSYNNNGKPWKSSRILRVKPNFFIFSFFPFFIFSFSSFFEFFSFSLFFFFFSFFQFFHFLCLVGCSKSDFLGLNCFTTSRAISKKKNMFFSRLGEHPFFSLFSFFLLFFMFFISFFFFFIISFFVFLKNVFLLFFSFLQKNTFCSPVHTETF